MTADQVRRALQIFNEACDLEPQERARFLQKCCGDDEALRERVEQMLALDATTEGAIEPAGGAEVLARELAAETAAPQRLGRYEIVREIGRGGMGVVYEAKQDRPRRRVALKVIRPELATKSLIRRLRYEAETLGHLDHPGIAHIYESSLAEGAEQTQAFFAMEYINGPTLDEHANQPGFGMRDKIELVARVCDAVQHAHQKGVIHRDLKPANILVKGSDAGQRKEDSADTKTDAIGQPKILDFGVARATDPELQIQTIETHPGQILGTLAYMSPEQVTGDSDVDVRADVYALGVILYELLAGQRPFDLSGKPMIEAARVIQEDTATRLSIVAPSLRGDVATIVEKAMEKERERRYTSAGQLAADLRRFLRDEPIAARPASAFYQLVKFSRRHRGLVTLATLAIALLLVGTTVATWGWIAATRARQSESTAKLALEEETADLEQLAEFQDDLLRTLDATRLGNELRAQTIEAARLAAASTLTHSSQEEFETLLGRTDFTNVANAAVIAEIVEQAKALIEDKHGDRPRAQAKMLRSLYPFLTVDRLEEALQLARRLYGIEMTARGPDHRDTLSAKSLLCDCLIKTQRYAEAKTICQEVHDSYLRVFGREDTDYLNSLVTYGEYCFRMGDPAGLEAAYRECIAAEEGGLVVDREIAIEARRRLSWFVVTTKGWEDSLDFLEANVEAARTDGQLDVLDVYTRSFVAEGYQQVGRVEESLVIAIEGFELGTKDLGEPSYATYLISKRLVRGLDLLGRMNEGLEYLQKQLELSRLLYGEHHLETVGCFLRLGRWFALRDRHDEAIPILRKEHELRLVASREASWDMAESRALLRWSLDRAGVPHELERSRTLEGWRTFWDLFEKQGRWDKALFHGLEYCLRREKELGRDHEECRRDRERLRRSLIRQGYDADILLGPEAKNGPRS